MAKKVTGYLKLQVPAGAGCFRVRGSVEARLATALFLPRPQLTRRLGFALSKCEDALRAFGQTFST